MGRLKGVKQKKHNWTKIRNEYIQSNITYKGLAKKYNIPHNSIWTIAAPQKEGWNKLKKEYQKRVREETISVSVDKDVEIIQRLKEKERKQIDLLEQVAVKKLISKSEDGQQQVNDDLSVKELSDVASVFEKCQRMRYKSFGIEKLELNTTNTEKKVLEINFSYTAEETKEIAKEFIQLGLIEADDIANAKAH